MYIRLTRSTIRLGEEQLKPTVDSILVLFKLSTDGARKASLHVHDV
jgi:hypothetical protein